MIDEMIEEMKVMISKEIDDSTILGASMIDSIYDHIDEIAEKYKAKEESAFEQIKWERDCAIKQLEELDTSLGEKPEIARQRIQNGKWIPVEDRLPKYDYECVLVWLKDKCYDIAIWHSLYGFRPWYAEYFQDCPKEWENGVVAWIPLPEYTKGGAE